MNVLYLTDSRYVDRPWLDGSARYRCYHMAEALQAVGHRADVVALCALDRRILDRYDVVCVLRPVYHRRLLKVLARCQRLGIHCVADVDDLIFNPARAGSAPAVINGQANQTITRLRFARHARALRLFDEVTLATQALADEYTGLFPEQPVFVVPNGLSVFWLDYNQTPIERRQRIAYLPGTRSHDRDFATITPALQRIHREHPGLDLLLMNELCVPDDLFDRTRLVRQERVTYLQLPSIIGSCRLTLAPLEDNLFNAAKSHIKFIESAAFGTPLVSAPIGDMLRHQVAGLRFARTVPEWHDAVGGFLEPEHDERMARDLREYVRDCCMARHSVKHLIDRWSAPPNRPTGERNRDGHRTA